MVVPIFKDGEFLGSTGGCGLLLENGEGEVDIFLATKELKLTEVEVEELSKGIGVLPQDKIDAAINLICQKLKEIGADIE